MPESDHFVALGLGSNLGDREANLARALAALREVIHIERISPVYETRPVGFAQQPEFLNCACSGRTALAPRDLRRALAAIERRVGRAVSFPMGPRAIDLDILVYDDLVMNDDELTIPHPRMRERAFVLAPLRDIAPALVEPVSGRTIARLAADVDMSGVRKCEGGLVTRIRRDVQEMRPQVPLALNRAGVTGVKTTVSLPLPAGRQSVIAVLDVFADLDAEHSGVHMSRFSQDLEDALFELARQADGGLEALSLAVARRVVESQRAEVAHVDLRAEFSLPRHTPASGIPTNEYYTALATAVVAPDFARSVGGVEAEGITACPCAQSMVAETSRERLAAAGFTPEQIETVLSTVPIATHNQRGRGTLLIGGANSLPLPTMVAIVEQSMSSETYDLLKRPDELFVVNKAHSAPRFVEDVVREMLRYAHDALAEAPDDAFVFARQLNYESIHKHDAVAESCALLGELRRELAGETGVSHTSIEQWLYRKAIARTRG
ncbi:MAG: GTP cyclohydrolase I FolE2 [Candidatus Eremiobacteraeota bacterium]|nr:GTP cyclohydrolase I FolE2 [Candidatus Eremiobacteraeota bacterium]